MCSIMHEQCSRFINNHEIISMGLEYHIGVVTDVHDVIAQVPNSFHVKSCLFAATKETESFSDNLQHSPLCQAKPCPELMPRLNRKGEISP